jgi:hypothetical protein
MEQQEANGTLPATIRNKSQYKRGLGKINMAESLRFVVPNPNHQPGKWQSVRKQVPCSSVKLLGATIGMTGGYWHVSIQVEVPSVAVVNTHPVVGVDVGIKESAVVSGHPPGCGVLGATPDRLDSCRPGCSSRRPLESQVATQPLLSATHLDRRRVGQTYEH